MNKYLNNKDVKTWLYSTFGENSTIAESLFNLKAVIFFDYDGELIEDVPLRKFIDNLDHYIEHYGNQEICKLEIVHCKVYKDKVLTITFFCQKQWEDICALAESQDIDYFEKNNSDLSYPKMPSIVSDLYPVKNYNLELREFLNESAVEEHIKGE